MINMISEVQVSVEKNSSFYGLRLRSTNQYINEKNRSDLLSVNEQHRFHEVELCFNLVKKKINNYLIYHKIMIFNS